MASSGGPEARPDAPVGVVILGMHRSGTSAVAGMFARAGFFAGRDEDLLPADKDNPVGYYESLRIYGANERVLKELRGSWFDPPAPESQHAVRSSAIPELRGEFEDLIRAAERSPVVLKDPRISVMLSLWAPAAGGRLHPVLVVRHPLEVAQSVARRDGTPLSFGLAIWELHIAPLFEYLQGRVVTVVPYAALLADSTLGPQLVQSATDHLDPARGRHVRPADARDAIRPELRHHEVATADHESLTLHQRKLWDVLSSLPCGTARLNLPARLGLASPGARLAAHAETERVRTKAAQESLRRELANETARASELRAEVERLTERGQQLENAQLAARHELEELRHELEELRQQYMMIVNSRRWRVTAHPARVIGAWRAWRTTG